METEDARNLFRRSLGRGRTLLQEVSSRYPLQVTGSNPPVSMLAMPQERKVNSDASNFVGNSSVYQNSAFPHGVSVFILDSKSELDT